MKKSLVISLIFSLAFSASASEWHHAVNGYARLPASIIPPAARFEKTKPSFERLVASIGSIYSISLGSYNPGTFLESFEGGAGTFTWKKPQGCGYVLVFARVPGGAGGSGGFSASTGGGGGGAPGSAVWSLFKCSILGNTEHVILGIATGGNRVNASGNGNQGGQPSETSFGDAGENLFRYQAPQSNSGLGGTSTTASGGTNPGIASLSVKVFQSYVNPTSLTGGQGKSTAAGGNAGTGSAVFNGQFVSQDGSGGAGGGGTNGGANFTNGGNAGSAITGSVVVPISQTQITGAAGPSTDGGNGSDGTDGGLYVTGSFSQMFLMGGLGGAGGAGAIIANNNGGNGGKGGNCGGGGGGGGSSETGTLGSGAGGNGGAACMWVFAY